ncbi:hypothetical protein [Vibrio sp. H11]|uniref:hypothetical protein n=1 Tax=Vibrio sp. H11 TaxID=2565928 RepID=UPI0010A5BC5F|nr:hypothetical protein [Vibrio sp. H11]
MKKWLCLVTMVLFTPFALASAEVADPALTFDWPMVLTTLLGDTGQVIALWVTGFLVIWSQLRQLIPPKWLAKLPTWLIAFLEFLAANRGTATNDVFNDPLHHKKTPIA